MAWNMSCGTFSASTPPQRAAMTALAAAAASASASSFARSSCTQAQAQARGHRCREGGSTACFWHTPGQPHLAHAVVALPPLTLVLVALHAHGGHGLLRLKLQFQQPPRAVQQLLLRARHLLVRRHIALRACVSVGHPRCAAQF
jgi:hypothetical protein